MGRDREAEEIGDVHLCKFLLKPPSALLTLPDLRLPVPHPLQQPTLRQQSRDYKLCLSLCSGVLGRTNRRIMEDGSRTSRDATRYLLPARTELLPVAEMDQTSASNRPNQRIRYV